MKRVLVQWMAVLAVIGTAPAAALVVSESITAWRLPPIPAQYEPRVISSWAEYGSPPGESVRLVIFSDYLCPASSSAWRDIKALQESHPDVVVEWRHYPRLGGTSFTAATAVECARSQGQFEPMHDWLHTNTVSSFVSTEEWLTIAAEVGVKETATFRSCLLNGLASANVREDMMLGQRLGTPGTPAILLDSLLFRGTPGIGYLRAYATLYSPSRGK